MELREVIFLKTLPNHPHLVPAYDIFLDPLSRKLHIAMEYMDGNLYQLMKSRDHKPLDCSSVKSILYQILSGLEHIHENNFFHRDIKPENVLVTSSSPETGNSFRRYSALMTPPSTPPAYTIKLADFGLARETQSRTPYTTYVSTRWYRAPEVLLRAGEYSAPVDIWALGAMAVEIATLKPLFPGGNEVDQVWRVCEIMGSPGAWINRNGAKVGGGEWKDGVKLAQKLGFSFPKMAPHSVQTILQAPQWPESLAHFVTWCLMWDPSARPTSSQALAHDFFTDAVDPLRPKSSSTSRLLGRKHSTIGSHDSPDTGSHGLSTKTSSWFRKSLQPKDSPAPAVPEHQPAQATAPARPTPVHANTTDSLNSQKVRPGATKRNTWTNGAQSTGAPIPILPSIRPVSPLSDASNAQAHRTSSEEKVAQKIGRQLSMNSHGNHYADYHRQEAEKALTGGSGAGGASGLSSPTGNGKESFFSHLRKRARRFSGRHQTPVSPPPDDIEANAGCAPWVPQRQSMAMDVHSASPSHAPPSPSNDPSFAELDKVLQNVRSSLDAATHAANAQAKQIQRMPSNSMLKRHHSLHGAEGRLSPAPSPGPVSARTRRSVKHSERQAQRYETPDEEDELLDEALASADRAARRLDDSAKTMSAPGKENTRPLMPQLMSDPTPAATYLTPSPSKEDNSVEFANAEQRAEQSPSKPMQIAVPPFPRKDTLNPQWPTPPYEENEWAASAAASIFAAQAAYR